MVILFALWFYFCNRTNQATPHHTGVICLGTLSVILIRSNVILVASDLGCLRWHLITRAGAYFHPLQPPSSAHFVIFGLSLASEKLSLLLQASPVIKSSKWAIRLCDHWNISPTLSHSRNLIRLISLQTTLPSRVYSYFIIWTMQQIGDWFFNLFFNH